MGGCRLLTPTDHGAETVALFPETAVTDTAGATTTKAGAVGVIAKAVVEPIPPDAAGEPQPVSIPRYRLRLVNHTPPVAGLFQVEWNGSRWNVEGDGCDCTLVPA